MIVTTSLWVNLNFLRGLILIANITYTSILGNPISEGVPTQPATHTGIGGQGLNRDVGQAVGQSVKRPMADAKDGSAKRLKLTNCVAAPSLSRINFARSKIFSSRPTINSRGDVAFGFRHNCELNCFLVPAYHPCMNMVLIKRCRCTKPISE